MTITTRLEQRVARNIDRPETHDVGFERRDRIGRRRGRWGDSGPNFHSTAAPDSAITCNGCKELRATDGKWKPSIDSQGVLSRCGFPKTCATFVRQRAFWW